VRVKVGMTDSMFSNDNDPKNRETVPAAGGVRGKDARDARDVGRSLDRLSNDSLSNDSLESLSDSLDSKANALLRAVAHAPSRRPVTVVVPGTKWGDHGRYVILERLGRGGMGSVYAATDTKLERKVALKVLDAADVGQDAAYKARLLREAKIAARVEHERIARVYDVGDHEGVGFVEMEYVQGSTLRTWMAGRRVSAAETVDIAVQIAEGLAALHASGVIHRDLKPENVMLTAQGKIKLLDFGLARAAAAPSDHGPAAGRPVFDGASIAAASGTPGYMAPEQCAGKPIDERVDVFALGVILYELVTGERLFRGDTVGAVIETTLSWTPDLSNEAWHGVPVELRNYTARMLARDPDQRFANGGAVLAELVQLSNETSRNRVGLPGAVVHDQLGKAQTQLAPRRFGLGRVRRGVARRSVEVACAVAAVVFVVMPRAQPVAPPVAPPGMALIDVGTIDVGMDPGKIDDECAQIGSACPRKEIQEETPRIEVTVAPFFLDQTEVTNEKLVRMLNQLAASITVVQDKDDHYPRFVSRHQAGKDVILADLYDRSGDRNRDSGIELVGVSQFRVRPGSAQLPASLISWDGAKLYCEYLGKRLPTETEWEAAARGRDDRRFPWGNALPRCNEVVIPNDGTIVPTSWGCAEATVARAVGTSPQDHTPDGVDDLAGNLTEWTASLWSVGSREPAASPGGDERARVVRGGSWGEAYMARSRGRTPLLPSIMGSNLGFRCASNVPAANSH
jgi:formylglycine-generating enzyme required for sulfatase activity/predicted Ser/Thr protein kinase